MPLIDRVIGNAVQTDIAVGPGLNAGPLDALVEVSRLARREVIDITGRSAGSPGVHAYTDIAKRNPFFRVNHFPVLVFIGRSERDVRVTCDHVLPGARIAFLKGQSLRVDRRSEARADFPSATGRNTSARTTTPSSMVMPTSQSMSMLSRSTAIPRHSLPWAVFSPATRAGTPKSDRIKAACWRTFCNSLTTAFKPVRIICEHVRRHQS